MASTLYAIEIKKKDLALIGLLNNGVVPLIEKPKTYFVFEVEKDGSDTVEPPIIISERELHRNYEIAGNSPFFARMKKSS